MGKVFVSSMRYKNVDGEFVPAADISPAAEYGQIVYLTTPGNNPVTDVAINSIIDGMANVTDKDFVLLTGDTILTSIALAEMAGRIGMVRALRWNRREGGYSIEEWAWEPFCAVCDMDEVVGARPKATAAAA